MFLHRLAHSFNCHVFRVTLTITVFIVNAFYCIVLEKNKSKITHNNKMRLSTCTVSHFQIKSNQIKSLLLSHHHSTSALVSEILMSVLQTVQKNNRQFTYGQTVQKKTTDNLHMDRQCKKLHWSIYSAPDSAKNNNSNLHMDRQCKKATAIYIWTVHIYRLYRRQCAKYTYIYSVHIVYYKDILNYQRHIIHRMGTSALCTVSIHNVVYA